MWSFYKPVLQKLRVIKSRNPQAHQLQAGLTYMWEDSIHGQLGDSTSSDESFCLQVQIQNTQASAKCPTPHHLITNFEYRLKPHNEGNQYLRARLDTCADVNIMPASVYKLVFQDPGCKRLAPSRKLKIGTCTTDKANTCIRLDTASHQFGLSCS